MEKSSHQEGLERNVEFLLSVSKSLKDWRSLLLWAVVGAVVGLVIGLSTPKTYSVDALVAPEITTRSTMGGLSSLASLAGVNTSTMTMTDAMHPNLYPEIIHSSYFCVELFDMPVTVETKDSLVHTDLYTYITDYYKSPWWSAVMALPKKAADAIKGWFVKEEDQEADGYSGVNVMKLTEQQESVIDVLSQSINASVDKKSYILSLNVKSQDPVVAADLANYVIEKLQGFVLSYRTEKAQENLDYLRSIQRQSKVEYEQAQGRYARYLDRNQGVVGNSGQAVQQQLQNEANLRFQMYNQTSQKLLDARAKVQEEEPVLVVVQPGLPPHTGTPSIARLVILMFLFGAVLRFAWVVFGLDYLMKSLK